MSSGKRNNESRLSKALLLMKEAQRVLKEKFSLDAVLNILKRFLDRRFKNTKGRADNVCQFISHLFSKNSSED
jgi:hypothetical protein